MNTIALVFLFLIFAALIVFVIIDTKLYRKQREIFRVALRGAVDEVRADWKQMALGASGNIDLEMAFLGALQQMYETFIRKNRDYGTDNLRAGWIPGIVLRKSDKLSRLWQLSGMRSSDYTPWVKDESMADTFLDDANYSVAGYLMSIGVLTPLDMDQHMGSGAILEQLIDQINDLSDDDKALLLEHLAGEA